MSAAIDVLMSPETDTCEPSLVVETTLFSGPRFGVVDAATAFCGASLHLTAPTPVDGGTGFCAAGETSASFGIETAVPAPASAANVLYGIRHAASPTCEGCRLESVAFAMRSLPSAVIAGEMCRSPVSLRPGM